ANDSPIGRCAHNDVAKLLWRGQAALRENRIGKLLVLRRRIAADLAGGINGVLRLDRIDDIGYRDTEFREMVRLDPKPHRILRRAEDLRVSDARQAPARLVLVG